MAHSSFQKNAWFIFQDSWECWYCGKNEIDCLHHIMGRGGPASDVENSILNAAPLCNFGCHLKHHGKLMTPEWQKKLLNRTYFYLLEQQYKLTDLDKNFIEKYKTFYE